MRVQATTPEPASGGSIDDRDGVGDKSPRYRYSHSQAIALTVETDTP